tara:strand:- start:2628 stop:3731 length:1104 start_codon:yes stop_codon:yes gene_type:complete
VAVEDFMNFAKKCLRPPGEGVFTVSNAKDRKDQLHKSLYGSISDVSDAWLSTLAKNLDPNKSQVAALGICSDTGGGIQRGANWGPLFLRQTMIEQQKWELLDLGDVFIVPQVLHDKYLNDETISTIRKSIYQDENSSYPVSPLSITEEAVRLANTNFPNLKIFGIGGDHSISYSLVKAWAQAESRKNKKIGLIHFDAHTDLMIERLGIDLCFGTWVPPIIPLFESPSDIFQIGIRSSGQERSHWENKFGLHQLWAEEVKQQGLEASLVKLERYLKEKNFEEVYISFDIDALDASYAPATGTPEFGGLAPHEAKLFLDVVGNNCKVTGADMMELAPFVQIFDNPQGQWSTFTSAAALSQAMIEIMERD